MRFHIFRIQWWKWTDRENVDHLGSPCLWVFFFFVIFGVALHIDTTSPTASWSRGRPDVLPKHRSCVSSSNLCWSNLDGWRKGDQFFWPIGLLNGPISWDSWFLESLFFDSWWRFKKLGGSSSWYLHICTNTLFFPLDGVWFSWLWSCFGDRISSGSTTRFYPELLNAAPAGEGSDFEEPWSVKLKPLLFWLQSSPLISFWLVGFEKFIYVCTMYYVCTYIQIYDICI